MFTVELYARIRRAVMVDGLSRREAARLFGVHRNTVSKMLEFPVPPGYRRREPRVSKKLGPHVAWIDGLLEDDRAVHKKQRHTANRIFERLRDERGFSERIDRYPGSCGFRNNQARAVIHDNTAVVVSLPLRIGPVFRSLTFLQ